MPLKAHLRYYDPLIVDALVQRYMVPGASVADRAAAAKEFHRRGYTEREIQTFLRATEPEVERWIHVLPVAPYPEDDVSLLDGDKEEVPTCRQGHKLVGDNLRDSRHDRCAACYSVKMQKQREKRKAKTEKIAGDRHDAYTYQKFGCRCTECVAAHREDMRARRARKKAEETMQEMRCSTPTMGKAKTK